MGKVVLDQLSKASQLTF